MLPPHRIRILFEFSSSSALRKVSQALIRLHPEQHKLDYDAQHSQSDRILRHVSQTVSGQTSEWLGIRATAKPV